MVATSNAQSGMISQTFRNVRSSKSSSERLLLSYALLTPEPPHVRSKPLGTALRGTWMLSSRATYWIIRPFDLKQRPLLTIFSPNHSDASLSVLVAHILAVPTQSSRDRAAQIVNSRQRIGHHGKAQAQRWRVHPCPNATYQANGDGHAYFELSLTSNHHCRRTSK